MTVGNLLDERAKTHGQWADTANYAQCIKALFWTAMQSRLDEFLPEHKEALAMIASKLARIFSGGPNCAEHWRDIAGYAMLVANALDGKPVQE